MEAFFHFLQNIRRINLHQFKVVKIYLRHTQYTVSSKWPILRIWMTPKFVQEWKKWWHWYTIDRSTWLQYFESWYTTLEISTRFQRSTSTILMSCASPLQQWSASNGVSCNWMLYKYLSQRIHIFQQRIKNMAQYIDGNDWREQMKYSYWTDAHNVDEKWS